MNDHEVVLTTLEKDGLRYELVTRQVDPEVFNHNDLETIQAGVVVRVSKVKT